MGKIFGNLRPYKLQVLLIFLLLIVQAYCDLSLPQYTSDIIDVGITNHGVSHALPEAMTEDEYLYAGMFMTDEEQKIWEASYQRDGELYRLTVEDEETLDELDSSLQLPLLIDYQASRTTLDQFREMMAESFRQNPQTAAMADSVSDLSLEELEELLQTDLTSFDEEDENGNNETYVDVRPQVAAMMAAGGGTAILDEYRDSAQDILDAMGETTLRSMGAAFASFCDEKAGMDMEQLQMDYMWSVGLRMGLMSLVMLLAAIFASYIASGVGAAIGRDMRHDVFHQVMSFSSAEMNHFSTASLITRCTNDIQQIQMITVMLLRMVLYAPILGIGGVVKVVSTRAGMEWIIILGVAAIILFVGLLMRATLSRFRMMQKLVDALNLVSREILTGLTVIRAFGREEEEEQRFDRANKDLADTQRFTSRAMALMMPGMTMVMYGLVLLIVWVSANRIDAGTLQIGTMTAFITYSMQIVMSFLMLTVISIMLPRAGVAADRIDEVIRTEASIHEIDAPVVPELRRGEVRFEHVTFRYPGADGDVLSDITFTARPGSTTAMIGSTGSGKSTVVNLIPRFYDVTGGCVTVDGVDVRDMSFDELRGRIGFVPQQGVLFSGTIASNLRFGDGNADEDQIRTAAEIAQAAEFIDSRPDGFDSPVAQGGSNVSGGQKQRLSIARAVVRNPEIYIFDDSFSALDMKTDAALRKALGSRVENSTVIIVAQRISTILNADQIIVMDEGRIADIGTHEELMERCKIYRDIAESQLSPAELEQGKGVQ